MAQVVLENVSKVYPGNVVAATDVNLAIQDGEFAVLVGPSGWWESTILRMVAGSSPSPAAPSASATGGQRDRAQGPRHRHGLQSYASTPT